MPTRVIVVFLGALACAAAILWWTEKAPEPQSDLIFGGFQTQPSFVEPQIPIAATALRSDGEIKKLSARAGDLIGKLKKTSDDLHLHFVGSLPFSPTSGTASSSGALLQTPNCSFRFWLPSEQVTNWDNDELELLLIQSRKRVEEHGYPFDDAGFKVQIAEGYCPSVIQIPEITPYQRRTESTISLERASSIAHEHAPKTATNWNTPTSPQVTNGRLLWEFFYSDAQDFRGGEPVYVDAYTGESVGYLSP